MKFPAACLLLAVVTAGCRPEASDGPPPAALAVAAPTAQPVAGAESQVGIEGPTGGPSDDAVVATDSAAVSEGPGGRPAVSPAADTTVTRDAVGGGDADAALLLLLDDEPLALADEEDAAPTAAADNSRCHHCHLNYIDEELAVVHARAKIGCANCHGNCDAHIADESWASGGNGTAPGSMYTKAQINPFCLDCHRRDTLDKEQHEALFAGTSKEKYCTDCHGDHRLTERKCKWK